MRKLSGYEKIMLSIGIIVGMFFIISLMKVVSYSVILGDHSLWNELTIYKMLGVEAAYVCAHCYSNFVSALIFRLVGWCFCTVLSDLLLIFRFIIPFYKEWKGNHSRND